MKPNWTTRSDKFRCISLQANICWKRLVHSTLHRLRAMHAHNSAYIVPCIKFTSRESWKSDISARHIKFRLRYAFVRAGLSPSRVPLLLQRKDLKYLPVPSFNIIDVPLLQISQVQYKLLGCGTPLINIIRWFQKNWRTGWVSFKHVSASVGLSWTCATWYAK